MILVYLLPISSSTLIQEQGRRAFYLQQYPDTGAGRLNYLPQYPDTGAGKERLLSPVVLWYRSREGETSISRISLIQEQGLGA